MVRSIILATQSVKYNNASFHIRDLVPCSRASDLSAPTRKLVQVNDISLGWHLVRWDLGCVSKDQLLLCLVVGAA